MKMGGERAPSNLNRKGTALAQECGRLCGHPAIGAHGHKSRSDPRFPNLYEGPSCPGRYEGQRSLLE
jgi:hypothetical protein